MIIANKLAELGYILLFITPNELIQAVNKAFKLMVKM